MATKKVSRKSNEVTSSARKKPGATGPSPSGGPEPRQLDFAEPKTSLPISPIGAAPGGSSGAVDRRKGGGASEPRRSFSKGPTAEQFTAMAGAMYNALERLRAAHEFTKDWADKNEGWIDPLRSPIVLEHVAAVSNILRVGLKARFR